MPGVYVATGLESSINASTQETCLTVIAATTKRGAIFDVYMGSSGVPVDGVLKWLIRRFTAAGTAGAAVTPHALDPADPAALLTAGEDHSSEPTYTAGSELFDQGINIRSTFRVVPPPNAPFIVPATAANGIGISALSVQYAGAAEATAYWQE